MKKTTLKTFSAFLAAAGMAMSASVLPSCGNSAPQKSRVENAYDYEVIELGENVSLDTVDYYDGRVYYSDYEIDQEGNWLPVYRSVALDGSDKQTMKLKSVYGESGNIGGFALADDGTLWAGDFIFDWDTSDGNPKISVTIRHMNPDGGEISSTDISDYLDSGSYGFNNIIPSGDKVIVSFDRKLVVISGGSVEKQIDVDADYIDNIFFDRTGTLYLAYWDRNGDNRVIKKLDIEKGELSAAEELPKPVKNNFYDIFSGPEYDFYYAESSTGLYACSFGDETATEVCNFINSDVDFQWIQKCIVLPDGKLLIVPQNEEAGYKLYVMTKRPDDKNPEKYLITLGCVYLDSALRSAISGFNRSSDEYRIVVRDYSSYSTEDDWQGGFNKMNQDIISGNSPDIIAVTSMTPYMNYVSKGVFEPLNGYLDGEGGIDRSEYLDNIFRAAEINGELYSVISAFMIDTVACKKTTAEAALGRKDIKGATVADYMKIISANPGARTFNYYTRDAFPSLVAGNMLNEFLDMDTGRCSFDSREFIELLEFGKTLPEKSVYDESGADTSDDSFWEEIELSVIKGKTLFENIAIADYRDFWQTYKGGFGGDMVMIGWPGSSGSAGTISAQVETAISSSSRFKDQAWQFIMYLLSDENQSKLSYILPVRRGALSQKRENAVNPPKTDEYGYEVDYSTYWIGGQRIEIGNMDKETADTLDGFIESVTELTRYDEKIETIIGEEASAFFSGAKSAEETARLIQNRVQTYVSEQR